MTIRRRLIACVVFLIALVPTTVAADPCFVVVDDKPAPDVAAPEVNVRQIIRLTKVGIDALGSMRFAYVQIIRDEGQQAFVRLLESPTGAPPEAPRETRFTFSRDNTQTNYTLRLFGSSMYAWPAPATLGSQVSGCDAVAVTVDTVRRRPDFSGVRGQWWGAYYPLTRAEIGASLFLGRLGFAASGDVRVPRTIGPRDDPKNFNPITGSFEVRWRGARGYLGGGARYYPDDEVDRDHWRFAFVAGEELPSFKGLPIWLVLNLRLEEPRKNFVKGLRPEFGFRFDWWGSQP